MDNESVIKKIKSLLAMSSDVSTSQHERDLALQRAQELMAKYSVDIAEHQDKSEEIITHIISFEQHKLPALFKLSPLMFMTYIEAIPKEFGCYMMYNRNTFDYALFGFKTNCEIAEHAIHCILAQALIDFREQMKEERSIGFTVSFWNGFKEGLAIRFLKLSDSTAIQLYDKVKNAFVQKVNLTQINMPRSNAAGFDQGFKSAKDAQIRSGIGQSNKGGLLK